MEYHSADSLSSTDYSFFYSIDSIDDSFLSGNPYNSYNISYIIFIFSWIILSFLGNYSSPPYNFIYASYDFLI